MKANFWFFGATFVGCILLFLYVSLENECQGIGGKFGFITSTHENIEKVNNWVLDKVYHTARNGGSSSIKNQLPKQSFWKRYAIFSSDTPSHYRYIFTLPLTVRAWRRVGYGSIVLLIGQKKTWETRKPLKVVLDSLKDLKATVLFIDGADENAMSLSQISRLFVSNFLHFPSDLEDSIFLMTTDADLWPLNNDLYDIGKSDREVLLLNSECCGTFKHNMSTFRMYPMANIGMTVRRWKEVMKTTEKSQFTAKDTLEYFVAEFGDLAEKKVTKGMNEGWFMDQHMISIRLTEWLELKNNHEKVLFIPRYTWQDRLDRGSWTDDVESLTYKNDTHLWPLIFSNKLWPRILPVLEFMFKKEEYKECQEYRETFMASLH